MQTQMGPKRISAVWGDSPQAGFSPFDGPLHSVAILQFSRLNFIICNLLQQPFHNPLYPRTERTRVDAITDFQREV